MNRETEGEAKGMGEGKPGGSGAKGAGMAGNTAGDEPKSDTQRGALNLFAQRIANYEQDTRVRITLSRINPAVESG